ncbi:MAG: molybdopterin molybdotransferase MoeA [Synergistaceae bacterium]|jgi:molybdopterin molybdotransferase|nr:molybdopterin molybdotransferase MoeA [Synergistaceae bacterium]
MRNFVEDVKPIGECVRLVSGALGFPWGLRENILPLGRAFGLRSSRGVTAGESMPPFDRSLRDGYAVSSAATTGASPGSPAFVKIAGEIAMGETPEFEISGDEAASIATGGMMPRGADAVVMIEDTEASGGWLEVRRAVPRGENVVFEGEEMRAGGVLVRVGDQIDHARAGLLSAFGIAEIGVADLTVGVISTGDEIVSAETSPLPPGRVRDSNTYILGALCERYGFNFKSYGLAGDSLPELRSLAGKARDECDAVLLSGGSSVGARDHTLSVVESLSGGEILVRGINMVPGKPTIIGGSARDKKLIAGLPGHPMSCAVSAIFVILPLMMAMMGARDEHPGRYLRLPLAEDVHGRTGPDEFIPASVVDGAARPLAAKSGYVSALMNADGFIRLRPDTETLRRGESAEIWIW